MMPRPIRSFAARQAEAQKQDVLDRFTLTERLLVEILIQLLGIQTHCDQAHIASRLKKVGLTTKQIAALLDTTPASLAVSRARAAVE
jgi:hypothetical protein